MSSNNFRLALDFYQSPGGHEALVEPDSPMPPEISYLLDMLDADSDEHTPGLSQEMRRDIEFLLERVLFAPGGDYYRVLGLNRDASPEQIRKNYNQLIRIFFNGDKAEEWNAAYAMHLNRAYSILRDYEKRRAYDQGVKYQSRTNVSRRRATDAPRSAIPGLPGAALSVEARTAPEPERSAAAPSGRRQSPSYVAKSIDRAHSGAEPAPALQAGTKAMTGTAVLRPDIVEHVGAVKESFPHGIPLPEESASRKRPATSSSFFDNKVNLALLGGVIVVIFLYIAMLPSMMESSTSHIDEEPAAQAPVEETSEPVDAVATSPEPQPEASPMLPEPAAALPAATIDAPPTESPVTMQQDPVAEVAPPEPPPPAVSKPQAVAPASKEVDKPASKQPAAVAGSRDPQPRSRAAEAATERDITAPVVIAGTASSAPAAPPPTQTATVVSPQSDLATARPTLPPAPRIDVTPARAVATIQELDNLASTFARAYETGNLELMLSLFADNARTNERNNKAGIRSDYEELFRVTDRREFIIDGLRWQDDRDGDLKGTGDFRVNIRFRDDKSENSVTGNVVIRVEKRPQGIVITEFRHTYR